VLGTYCNPDEDTELHNLIAAATLQGRTPRNPRPTPRANTIPASTAQLIITGYEEGASTYELAARLKLRRNTIRDVLRRNSMQIVGAKVRRLTDEDKLAIQTRRREGATIKDLAREYSVSPSTIRRAEAK
jgi:IS30 family transposase